MRKRSRGGTATSAKREEAQLFSVGLVADTQYCTAEDFESNDLDYVWVETKGQPRRRKLTQNHTHWRRYAHSLAIFKRAVSHFGSLPRSSIKACIHLGDVVDKVAKERGEVDACKAEILHLSKIAGSARTVPWFYLVGNNDLQCMSREEWCAEFTPICARVGGGLVPPPRLGSPPRPSPQTMYFDWSPRLGFRFVFLDGFDMSALPRITPPDVSAATLALHTAAVSFLAAHATPFDCPDESKQRFKNYNGALGPGQLAWLGHLLTTADERKERVFLFCHLPVDPTCCRADGLLWNNDEVLALLHAHRCCCAYISGHDHTGGFNIDSEGVVHLSPPAPLEAAVGDGAFGTLEFYHDYFCLDWHGAPPRAFTIGPCGWPAKETRLGYRDVGSSARLPVSQSK